MQIYHANRLHELTVDKLLECHRQCVAIAKAITPDEPAGTKDRAIAISKVIDFELNAKLTLESQNLIKKQIAELERNTEVSKNQLTSARAIVKEAKSTTKLSHIIVALTGVLAVQNIFLTASAVKEIGIINSTLIVILLFAVFMGWTMQPMLERRGWWVRGKK